MINKTKNYRIVAITLNSNSIKHLYVRFPLYSKCIPILMYMCAYIGSSKVRTPSATFWRKND